MISRILISFSVFVTALTLSFCANAFKLFECSLTESAQTKHIKEHLYEPPLDNSKLHVKRAYVMAYNEKYNVPSWAAWHATKEYLGTPKRKKKGWGKFRSDPSITSVHANDYKHWHASKFNYARGHLVPYYISGGDRDNDGLDADNESTHEVEDKDDACTVYEVNSVANITPQYHSKFNGSGGLWYELETKIRERIKKGEDLYIIAGTIFDESKPVHMIGKRTKNQTEVDPSWNIGVPHGFFKIIVNPKEKTREHYQFNHTEDVGGCELGENLTRCIKSSNSVFTRNKIN